MCILFTKIGAQTTYNSVGLPITISNSEASVTTTTINVPDQDCVSDVNVLDLSITHTWVGDLHITLTSPEGTSVVLMSQICGSNNDVDLNFDDSGSDYSSIPCPSTGGGTYHPSEDLAAFVGENMNGDWVLSVEDNSPWDGGSVDDWSLQLSSELCYQPSGACDDETPFFAADLSDDPSMSYISTAVVRDGNCCGTGASNPPSNCIEFEVILNENAVGVSFDIFSGAVPGGALFYQIDCGEQAEMGEAICLTGQGPYTITFCKPGNNTNEYIVQSIPSGVIVSDVIAFEGCEEQLEVIGMEPGTITWNDITSGTGEYNDNLSCTDCAAPNVLFTDIPIPEVQYEVCGDVQSSLCPSTSINVCKTVTVDLRSSYEIIINPYPVIFCLGASSTPEVIASTTISGDYDFTWYNGTNGSGGIVSDTSFFTPTSGGDYSVVVYDVNLGVCSEKIFNVDVQIITCEEDCTNNIDDDFDGMVDAFDDDCPCEDGSVLTGCDPTCEYIPPNLPNFTVTEEWSSSVDVNTLAPIVGGEMDGDYSSIELIALDELSGSLYDGIANNILIIDGATGVLKYRPNTLEISQNIKGIAIADADKDGNAEFYYIVGNDNSTYARRIACYEFDPSGTNPEGTGTGTFVLKWTSSEAVDCGLDVEGFEEYVQDFSVSIADFNYDGTPEVYVGNEIFNAINGQKIADGGTNSIGSSIFDYDAHFHFHAYPVAMDVLPDYLCDDCSGLELVAGNQVYAVDIANGTMTVESQATNNLRDGMTSIVDYDVDGDLDGVITTTTADGSYLYIWDLQSDNQIGETHTVTEVFNPWYRSVSNAVVADFDGDNLPEIGVCGNYTFQVVDDYTHDISGAGGVLWSIGTTDNSGMTGATAFDFNGDGVTEVVYRDENNLRIISGPTGLNLSTYPCGSVTGTEYPVVADIDYDGETEVVCNCGPSTYSGTGSMKAFKSDTYPWVPTRSVWNQYSYFVTNINDDLSIPIQQQPHHMVGNPTPGVSGRINTFLKQVGPTNDLGEPIFPAANLETSIMFVGGVADCSDVGSIDITIKFLNSGDLAFPAGTSFAVYDGNPEVAATIVDTYTFDESIAVNDSVIQIITVDISSLSLPTTLCVLGNDNGSLSIPFDIENDFPVTTIGECDFENNLDHIEIDFCDLINDTEAPVIILTPTVAGGTGGNYPTGQSYFEFENGNWAQAGIRTDVSDDWKSVTFEEEFNSIPIVLTQVVTENEDNTVVPRVRNLSTIGFEVKIQAEEDQNNVDGAENVGWIAMEEGISSSNVIMETFNTGTDVRHNWYEINFNEAYSNTPIFLAGMVTYNSSDPAYLRYRNLSTNNIEVKIQEEKSDDTETNHGNEIVSYAVFNEAGLVPDVFDNSIAEVGRITLDHNSSSDDWTTITTLKEYVNPVVVAGPVSNNQGSPVTIRVRNVNADNFQIQLEEWDYLNNSHDEETIHYMVMEMDPQNLPFVDVVGDEDNCDLSNPPSAPTVTVTDNCDNNVDIVFSEDITGDGCGATITRTWVATDDCGNETIETEIITSGDTETPVLTLDIEDVTVYCDGDIPTAIPFDCTTFLENVALNKSVSQSSISSGGTVTRGVDGNTSGAWGDGSVTHTSNDANAWFEVDLGEVFNLDSLELWGRTDCCSDRLSDYYIFISEDPFTSTDLNTTLNQVGVSSYYFNTIPLTSIGLDERGRYVRVQLNETNYLSIAELKVFSAISIGACATDDCDEDLDYNFVETSTQTNNGTCTDQNYEITRTWTATDDCGNVAIETQTVTVLCECCGNGIDDDGDGLIDNADSDCGTCSDDEVVLDCSDTLLYYYVPPVWQLNSSLYNNDPSLIITTLFSEANVNIVTADGITFNQTVVVNNGSPSVVSLTIDELQTPNNNTVESDRGFIIESDREINILYRMDAYNNQFLAKIKGAEALGNAFRAGSQTKTCGSPNTSRRENHFVSVMATEDNTIVSFSFSTNMSGPITSPHGITLNRGETYTIIDSTNTTVSGLLIAGDKPISVMSGSQNTNICDNFLADSGLDHIVPICNVGTEYAVVRGDGNNNQNYAVIVGTENNTEIYINGNATPITTIGAGDYYEYELNGSLDDAYYIRTSNPAYVYQFSGMSTVNTEVGMTVLPPLTSCNGDRKVDFSRFDGADIQRVQIIADDSALPSLTINGSPYSDYTTAESIPGLSGFSTVSIEDGLIDIYNVIESAEGFFHVGLVTGISNISGTFSYITGFDDNLDIYDPVENAPTTYYFADSICVGTTYTHCLTVASCTDDNSIVSITNDPTLSTVNTTLDLCFEYTPATDAIGTEVITVLVENEYGKQKNVCIEIFVCNGISQLTIIDIPSEITLDCEDPVEVPIVPIQSEGCVTVEFTEILTTGSTGCADNSYILERKWIARGFCGTDSLAVSQTVNVVDNTPPVIVNVPDDIDLQCQDCLQSFLNGDFEGNTFGGSWSPINENNVPGWSTTAPDNRIEIQKSGQINGVSSYSGNFHAELNHNSNGDLYQEFCTIPTTTLQVSFAHAKRPAGSNTTDDIMAVYAGPDITNVSFIGTYTATSTSGWIVHTFSYPVPLGQETTVIAFRAIQGAPSNLSLGNLIDDVNVITLFDSAFIPDASDNCDSDVELILSEEEIVGNCENHFQLIRTWTAIDNCGNSASATQTLSVGDFEPPTFSNFPPNITVDCENIPPVPTDIITVDNCTGDAEIDIVVNEDIGTGCYYQIIRTWSASDNCDNTADTFQVITVIDTVAPVFSNLPEDITVDCGNIPTIPTDILVTDNCSDSGNINIILTEDIGTGCTYNIVRTWSAFDDCNNEVLYSQIITVQDTTAPVFTSFPADVTFDCNETVTLTDPVAQDDCGAPVIITYNDVGDPASCVSSYSFVRTWTATDSCGNSFSQDQMVSILDDTPPVITNVPEDLTVNCNNIPVALDPIATDDCGTASISLTEIKQSETCEDAYEITRTWTAEDECGNTSEAFQIITVIDTIRPTVVIAAPDDITIDCDDTVPAPVDPEFTDNCANTITVFFEEILLDGCDANYIITRRWTATDNCGNVTIEEQVITIVDRDAPVLSVTPPVDVTVDCNDIPSFTDVAFIDNCDLDVEVVYSFDSIPGVCSNAYTLVRNYIGSDNCGNEITGSQSITVQDTTGPLFVGLPSDTTLNCNAIIPDADVQGIDNCTTSIDVDLDFDEVRTNGTCNENYTLTRTWTLRDDCGNETIGIQVIIVQDTIVPIIIGTPNDTIVNCDEVPSEVILTATDNCDSNVDIVFSEVRTDGSCEGAYILTRTWVASDNCGNQDSVKQVITVQDNVDPILIGLPNDTIVSCNAIPDTVDVTVADNCNTNLIVLFSENVVPGTCINEYVITRIWTASDNCGNSVTGEQIITVDDNTGPVFDNPPSDITVECGTIVDPGVITGTDLCGGAVTVTYEDTSVSGENIENYASGSLNEIIGTSPVYSTFDLSGYDNLTASDIVDLTLEFRTRRGKGEAEFVLIAPSGDAIVLVGEHCNGGDCEDGDFGFEKYELTFYHCGLGYTQWDNAANLPEGAGDYIPFGGTDSGYAGINQYVNCFGELTGTMNGTWTIAGLRQGSGPITLDNYSLNINNSSCLTESGITRVFTAIDDCGNASTYTQNISYEDTTAPSFDTSPLTINDINCGESLPVQEILSASDCGGTVNVVPTVDAYTVDVCGGYSITYRWTAEDACGNTNDTTQTFNVLPDDVDPTLSFIPADTIVSCGEIPDTILVTATDNCYLNVDPVYTETRTDGTCDEGYVLTRIWTATDSCGNVAIGTQIITVEDIIDPVLVDVPNDTTLACGAIIPTVIVTATDNCDLNVVPSFAEVRTDGACDEAYTLTRTWTALDNCGNEIVGVQVIVVEDITAPQLIGVPMDTVVNCTEIPDTATVTGIDICDSDVVVSIVEAILPGVCPGNYTLTRTWTGVDNCGNEIEEIQTILVQDTIAPVFDSVPNDTIVDCKNIPDAVTLTATDNCGGLVSIIPSEESFAGECVDFYNITRTWIATDLCGNADTITQIVSVIGCGPGIEVNVAPDSIICEGTDLTMSVTLTTGYPTPNYLWQFSEDSLAWINIPSSNVDTYTGTVDSSNDGWYQVIVANSPDNFDDPDCSVVSNAIRIEILDASPDTNLDVDLCQGESYTIGSDTYSSTGNYSVTLQNINGCDSIVNLNLQVNDAYVIDLDEEICEGEIFTVGTTDYTATGIYTETLQTVNGCDSIINLDLTVHDTFRIELVETICAGDTYEVGTSSYAISGIYTDVLQTSNGCDSTVVLDLTVNDTFNITLEEEICQGESFPIGSSVYTTSGSYTDVLTTANGCDSIVNLNLQVNDAYVIDLDEEICEGEIFTVGTTDYTATGVYTETLQTVNGCDSIINLDLTVHDTFRIELVETICAGDTYEVGTSSYAISGIYTDVLQTSNGCDSTVVLDLTVNDTFNITLEEEICQGESFPIGSSVYTISGSYTDVLTTANGCDSIVNLNLQVNDAYVIDLDEEICEGEIFTVGTTDYTATGVYTETLQTVNGCDSIINLDLTVHDTFRIELVETICAGQTYEVGTSSYAISGTYTDVLQTSNGCDSTVVLDLIVNDTFNITLDEEICQGESFPIGSSVYTISGSYTDVLTTANGCDSIVNLNLQVNDAYVIDLDEEICEGEIFTVGTTDYTATGVYTETLQTVNGCDSIINLDLTVHDTFRIELVETICAGDTYEVGTSSYAISGIYTDVLQTSNGCDSTVVLDLTVNDTFNITLEEEICQGESFPIGSSVYTTSGSYTDVLTTANGCDSIVNLNLQVNDAYVIDLDEEICKGEIFTVGTTDYTATGVYTETLQTVNGCDSIINLDLTVHDTFRIELVETICAGDTYEVGTSSYAISGIYTDVLQTSNGCDSTVVLDLTVNDTFNITLEEEICQGESFPIGSSVYTTSGSYTDVLTTANGCDSIVNLNLQVNDAYVIDLDEEICEGEIFTVGTTDYTATGVYTETLQTVNGCDSIINLDLTVHDTFRIELVETICAGQTYEVGTSSYAISGIYTDVLQTSNGCDSTVVLDLIVNDTFNITLEEEICQGESFPIGSSVYTTSGSYTDVLTTANGCDSIVNLNLQVNDAYVIDLDEEICEGEIFTVGTTDYTATGVYTETLQTVNGCDSIINLDLTVHDTFRIELVEIICAGDTYEVGTSSYAISGIYTDVLQTSNGCDSTVVLDLIVNDTFNITLEEEICQGESFPIGSSVYTTSGSYTDVLTTANGCDSIVNLNLQVNDAYVIDLDEEICEGEIFTVGTTDYTTTGVYSETLQTVNGCDSIINLDLTVNDTFRIELVETICAGQTYEVGTSSYAISGIYTDVLQTSNGCDSTVVLDLTVNDTFNITLEEEICQGESFPIGSSVYTTSGSYTDVLTTANGCDSIVNLNLQVNDAYVIDLDEEICEGEIFTVGTTDYTATGVYSETLQTVNGCDSIINLDLTVHDTFRIELNETICAGDTYTIGTNDYSITGIYTETLQTENGCDSTIVLDLTVNEVLTFADTVNLCNGETYNGIVYNASDIIVENLTGSNGCDSIATTNIVVYLDYDETVAVNLCEGGVFNGVQYFGDTIVVEDLISEFTCDSTVTYNISVVAEINTSIDVPLCYGEEYNGTNYTTNATLVDTYTAQIGCDSIVTTNIIVADEIIENIVDVICEGDSIIIGTNVYNSEGNYTDVLTSVMGCDSTVNLILSVNNTDEVNVDSTICQGESVVIGSNTYTQAGDYSDVLQNVNGCDSVVNLTLQVNNSYVIDIERTICQGEIFTVGTIDYSTTGTYTSNLTTVNGCDSIINLDLIVNDTFRIELTESICVGDSYTIGTNEYTTSGTFTDILQTENGCDSIVVLDLIVSDTFNITIDEVICQGETYEVGTNVYNTTGSYTDVLITNNGCDSIVNLNLVVNDAYVIDFEQEICQGEIFTVGTTDYSTTGIYTNNLTTVNGCDSIINLDLIVNDTFRIELTESICAGTSYSVGTTEYTETGIYTDVLQTENGCDSTVVLDLTVNEATTSTETIDICIGETYNGIVYNSNDVLVENLTGLNGCDSIATTNIVIHLNYDETIEVDLCEGGIFKGVQYFADAVVIENLTSGFMCDSIVTYQISVAAEITTNLDVDLCYGEEHDGIVYNADTTFANTYTASIGCDSIVTTNILVVDEIIVNLVETICEGDSVEIGVNVYKITGNYTDVLSTTAGCDSTINLMLTVFDISEETLDSTICQGESVTVGTSTYSIGGSYTDVLQNSNGCDSIVHLNLEVNLSYNVDLETTICEGNSVEVGTSVYTTTGEYTDILTTVDGCDSIVNLDLTVNPVYDIDDEITICEGDSIVVGTSVYSVAGNYTDVLQSTVSGCDSTVNLTLLVNQPVSTTDTINLCTGDTYDGVVYTSNTILENTYTGSNNCDSIVTTNLIVHLEYAENVSVDLCEGGVYEGVIYSADEVVVKSLISEFGCDSIVTITISVTPEILVDNPINLCYGGEYDGITYTSNTTLVDTYTSSGGCDSIVTTEITVESELFTDLVETICEGDSIVVGTTIYNTTGTTSDVLVSSAGCDSIVNLILVVNQPTIFEQTIDVCIGDTYEGIIYTVDETIENTYTGSNSCDSIVTTNIIVHPEYAENVSVDLCEGGVYEGVIYTADEVIVKSLISEFGCDSIVTITITVTPEVLVDNPMSLCYGGEYDGITYTSNTTLVDTYTSSSGCDSIVTTEITVESELITNLEETICEGDSIVVGAIVYNTTGTTSDILTSSTGCDSTVNLVLTVNQPASFEQTIDICTGDTYEGVVYTADETIVNTYTGSNNCDSIVTTNLIVHEEYSIDIPVELCEGGTYEGIVYTANDIIIENLLSEFGCDSVITTTITVIPEILLTIPVDLCFGVEYNGVAYTADTTLVDTYISSAGCDSIVTTDITVAVELTTNLVETICEGDSIVVGNTVYNSTGTTSDILVSSSGCDSIVNLILTVNQPTSFEQTIDICTGDIYEGIIYTANEVLINTLTGSNNCDSIVTTNLIVHEEYSIDIPVELCEGGTYEGIVYTTDDVIIQNLMSELGCDSVITTTITIIPEITVTVPVDLCYGEEYNGTVYTSSTSWIDTYVSGSGCDSIVTTEVNVSNELIANLDETICQGDSIVIGTSIYNTSGTFTDVLISNSGCDSTVTLVLIVNQPTNSETDIELCVGEDFNGIIYTSDTILIEVLTGINNCDSTATTNIVVHPVYSEVIPVLICEGESYEGIIYYADTTLVNNYTSINNCDSIISTEISVTPILYDTIEITLCEGDSYEGVVYVADTISTNAYISSLNCDSFMTTIITVNETLETNLNEIICAGDSIVVGSMVYTTTGNYSDILIGSGGCDSTVNLALIVNDTFNIDVAGVICEGESFNVGGFEFTDEGEHLVNLSTINGCDSIVNLSLIVNPIYNDTIYREICEGESITIGSSIYTTTGIYTDLLSTAANCDSTVVLDLTVYPVYEESIEALICIGDQYELADSFYTESGIYTAVLLTEHGCDSLVTVELTVVPVYTSTVYANICEGESYIAGGEPQTIEGTYYDTIINSVGCPNVLITHLSLWDVSEESQDISICEGESFFAGGAPQTSTGIYADTLSSQFGCDSIMITNLLVNPIYLDTIETSICEGESYFTAGANQTTAGIYVNNYQSVSGCDSIVIIDLDVGYVPVLSLPITMCEGEVITVNGIDYTETGVYIDSLNTSSGCDSLVTYMVTVIDQYETFFDEVICEGDSIYIAGAYRFEAGEFTEEYTSSNGCDSLIITELTIESIAELFAEDAAMCFGEEVQLLVEGSDFVQWSPSTGLSCDDCPNPIADPNVTTTYTVTTESCLGTTAEVLVTVVVNNPPSLTVSTNNDVLVNQGIELTAVSDDPDALITWYQNGEIVCEDCTEYTAEPSVNLSFFVIVEDEFGCVNSDNIDVNVNDACSFSHFEIPNIISPNGDGYNDYFEIKYEGVEEVSLLRVYNRWGELVYETYDIDNHWDGTFKGQKLNPGVFIYYMEGRCLDNEPFTKTGNLTILK